MDRLLWRRVVLVVSLLLSAAATASADTVRVVVDRALVWTRPTGVSFVVTQLSRDNVVEVLRRVGDWYRILLSTDTGGVSRTAFIRVSHVAVESVQPLSPQAARVLAAAAPRPSRRPTTVLAISGVYRWDGDDLTRSSAAFGETYAEDGSISTNYGGGGGWAFDVLVGQTVWGPVGVGIGGSYYQRKQPATVDAQVPHPFFFNQPRSATFETSPLSGDEIALHIPVIWMPQRGGSLRIMIYGGFSVFAVSQDVVTDLTLDDPYPNESVTIKGATVEERKGTAVGFHAGADLSWFFNRSVGVGVGGRYSRATFGFDDDPDAETTGLAGSAQAVAGLRFRF